MVSGLFGVEHSNRTVDDHWGKNRFNSSYPTATACYMLAQGIPAIYIYLDRIGGGLHVVSGDIPISQVFHCGKKQAEDLYFDFESVYMPYQQYSFERIDSIDLVVKDLDGNHLAPLEVKLTVLPTDSTSGKPEGKWGCELVIRSATTSYCALGMFDSVKKHAPQIREIFEDVCSSVQMWDNDYEVTGRMPALRDCIDVFQNEHYQHQKPLLMQTIWKTEGKSPSLADPAFDVVVWSDHAFLRLFADEASKPAKKMSRGMRSTARLARCLWELSRSGKIQLGNIYRQMAFGKQTDKEFSVGGSRWRRYVTSDRIVSPILPKDVVKEIISPQFIRRLSPERRFDQTLYFTMVREEENKEGW